MRPWDPQPVDRSVARAGNLILVLLLPFWPLCYINFLVMQEFWASCPEGSLPESRLDGVKAVVMWMVEFPSLATFLLLTSRR